MSNKSHTTISIDPELKEAAKKHNIVLSHIVEEAIKQELNEIDPELYNFDSDYKIKLMRDNLNLLKKEVINQENKIKCMLNRKDNIKNIKEVTFKADDETKQRNIQRHVNMMKRKDSMDKLNDPIWQQEDFKRIKKQLSGSFNESDYVNEIVNEAKKIYEIGGK